MKKKALSLFISAVMLSSVFAIPAAAAQTEDYLLSMTTEDKISQMIMPVFRYSADDEGNYTNVTKITDDIEAALEKHSFGGVIVMGQNTPTNEGTTRLTDAMQKANAKGGDRPQLLITIDQEGGTVTRLGQGTVMPGNMALGAANDTGLTKETASLIGSELRAVRAKRKAVSEWTSEGGLNGVTRRSVVTDGIPPVTNRGACDGRCK